MRVIQTNFSYFAGREVKVVLGQLDEVVHILDKIDQATDDVADIERAGEQLVDAGFSPDTIQTRDQIAGLRKTVRRLENRTKDQEDALQKTLVNNNTYHNILFYTPMYYIFSTYKFFSF